MAASIISISLPIHNGARGLEARLDNVAAQTFGDFQVLILDSASTDETGAVGRRYAARDPRFRYVRSRQKLSYDHAVLQNIYRGLDCRYQVLTSHSQRWAPTYLEECVSALGRHPQAVAAYSWCQFLGEERESWPAELPGGLCRDDFDLSGQDPVRRVLDVVEHQKFYTPFFGLISTEVCIHDILRPETLVREHLMTAVLALQAPLIQIDQPLLFRRWQPTDSSALELYRHCLGQPMELKPAPCSSDCFGYKAMFFDMLASLIASVHGASHLDSRQKEILTGQTVGAFIRRYQKELTVEMNATIERVARGWFYVWRASPTAGLTSKSITPQSLPNEDNDQPPSRPNLDLSVARRIRDLLSCYLRFFPSHPGLYYALGLTYRLMGRLAEAKTALEMELRHNPEYEPARQTLRKWE